MNDGERKAKTSDVLPKECPQPATDPARGSGNPIYRGWILLVSLVDANRYIRDRGDADGLNRVCRLLPDLLDCEPHQPAEVSAAAGLRRGLKS